MISQCRNHCTCKIEDENLLLNPDCASVNFLLHLKELLQAKGVLTEDSGGDIDVCDWQGVVKNLRRLHPMESIGPFVTHKETYIALLVNAFPNEEDDVLDYTPLLVSSNDKAFQTLHGKLNKQKKASRLPSAYKNSVTTKTQLGKAGTKSKQDPHQNKAVSKKPSKNMKT